MGNKRLLQSLIFVIGLNILTAIVAVPQSPSDTESSEETEDVDETEHQQNTTITYNVTTTENVTTQSLIATSTKSHRILKNNAPTPDIKPVQLKEVAKSTTENVHTFLVSYLPGVYENVEVNKPEEDLNYEKPYQNSEKEQYSNKLEISTTDDPLTKLVESAFEVETVTSSPDNEAVISINPSDLDIWKIVSATRRKNGRFSSTEIPPIRIPIEIRVSHVTPATLRPTPAAVKATAQISFQPNQPSHVPTKIGYHPQQESYPLYQPAQQQHQAYQPKPPQPAHQQPAYQPQRQAYQPQQPVYEPQQSAYQPQQSAYQPQQPANQPKQQPHLPQQQPHLAPPQPSQPQQPPYQPHQSSYQLQKPANLAYQPQLPPYRQQQPVYLPAQPPNQPIQPAYQPQQPVYQPVQPIYQPIQPVYLPVQAGNQLLQATNRPTQSATATATQNPINPGLQQTFFEGVAKLPSLVINTVENIECRLFDFCDGIDLDFLTK